MAEYSITFARSARKELESLDTPIVERIFRSIQRLSQCPRPQIGVYRVIYVIDDDKRFVDIIAVRHRRDAYK